MPLKAFLENYPLYKKTGLRIPDTLEHLPKPPISFDCPNCKSLQTYVMENQYFNEYGNIVNTQSAYRVVRANYLCVGCQRHERDFFIKLHNEEKLIEKVGQYPAWEIKGDKNIEKMLGDHRAYMRRGLICESQGYGIAAFAYYRRITEEIIDQLIEEIGDLIPEDERGEFSVTYEKVKATRQTSEKIDLVKDLLPSALKPEGMNPLAALHRALSEGLHAESDQRCLELAAAVRDVLTYLTSQVSEAKAQRSAFTDRMRKLLGGG